MNLIRKILNQSSTQDDREFYDAMQRLLKFSPKQLEFYQKAFTHRSLKKVDKNGEPYNYERLEFVGDAMLGSVIASYLFIKAPNQSEGYLTQMRSKIVSREHLNELGKDLNLISFVKSNIPKNNIGDNIHGNIFEALIGAIYLDRGYDYCSKFIYDKVIVPYVDIPKLEGKITSYKGLIIEWCQKNKKKYFIDTYEDTGNEPVKHFSVKIKIDDIQIAKGRATSKKKAEEQASKRVYFTFQKQIENS
ncbi:ribonuclease III [Flavobacteriaceae bacterium]|nr:ribonuclease III [Flavobacteriaceae bacterium]MDB2684551.1 ribonuclease III [Flavobacteriaceae bacterium]MDB4256759.1 ribonuclease III [Flavobacteriaceae bacterium]